MGKGSLLIKKLNPTKKYYNTKLDDEVYGDKKNFVIVPLHGWHGDRFFYVSKTQGQIEVMGEGYVIPRSRALSFAKEETDHIETVKFLVTAENGDALSEHIARSILKELLGDKYSDELLIP